MSKEEQTVNIQILDKKLQVKCPLNKAEALQESAYYLDGKMREIRDSGKAAGNEKIAMMTALNLAYELITIQKQKDLYLDTLSNRIKNLHKKVEEAVGRD